MDKKVNVFFINMYAPPPVYEPQFVQAQPRFTYIRPRVYRPSTISPTPEIKPIPTAIGYESTANPLTLGLQEPSIDLSVPTIYSGEVSWFTRIENKFCNQSVGESFKKLLTPSMVNALMFIVIYLLMVFLILPSDNGYNWMWGFILGALSYLIFGALIRCYMGW